MAFLMEKLLLALFVCLVTECRHLEVQKEKIPLHLRDTKILAIGGSEWSAGAPLSSMELYHPFNPQLNHVINDRMMQGRERHISALMDDGTVITVGGLDGSNTAISSCERFTPSTSTVSQCPSLNTDGRFSFASSVLNGVLYVCGGIDNDRDTLQSCERLLSNGWQFTVPLTHKSYGLAMASLNGYLYVMEGTNSGTNSGTPITLVEHRRVSDDHWTTVQSMNHKRALHSATVMEGKIFVCGGLGELESKLSSCERYDPIDNIWLNIPQMNRPHFFFGLVNDGSSLFAVGGDGLYDVGGDDNRNVEMYANNNHTWKIMQKELIMRRSGLTAVVILS